MSCKLPHCWVYSFAQADHFISCTSDEWGVESSHRMDHCSYQRMAYCWLFGERKYWWVRCVDHFVALYGICVCLIGRIFGLYASLLSALSNGQCCLLLYRTTVRETWIRLENVTLCSVINVFSAWMCLKCESTSFDGWFVSHYYVYRHIEISFLKIASRKRMCI